MRGFARAVLTAALAAFLAACGGGGGGSAAAPPAVQGSSAYAGICTLEAEKQFTRAYLEEAYLWYSEMPAVDAALFDSVPAYFDSLLTPQLDAYGQAKDRFSFIVPSAHADGLLTGANLGYGVRWEMDNQGRTRVAFVDAGSPAALAGLERGGERVAGTTTSTGASWYPDAPASISFVYRSTPAGPTRTVNLSTANLQEDPLPLSTPPTVASGDPRVWYLLFNAHTTGAQDKLIAALANAQAYGVQELVLDMRYNGGGFLYTALSLSSMVTGPTSDGKVFEQLRYNDKRAAETAQATILFSGRVQYGERTYTTGAALPRLGLPRVYVLSSDATCSASESVINSLRGVGVDVLIIGKTTCGKPYGFSRADNCGFAYFPIEFQGINAQGFGDYAYGFAPTCDAADDFDNPLGSTSERLLATALHHMKNGACPTQAPAALLAWRGPPTSERAPMPGKLLPLRVR
jgi:carboxyl-terminal processing protease